MNGPGDGREKSEIARRGAESPSQAEREADCARGGHPAFEVLTVQYKRSESYRQPKTVRCSWCHRTWPVLTYESWIPARYREE